VVVKSFALRFFSLFLLLLGPFQHLVEFAFYGNISKYEQCAGRMMEKSRPVKRQDTSDIQAFCKNGIRRIKNYFCSLQGLFAYV